MMNEVEQRIIESVQFWADHHPEPDRPVISSGIHGTFSPKGFAEAIQQRTEAGQFWLEQLVDTATAPDGPGLERFLSMMRGPT
jgi:hypothetical protein